MIKECDVLYLSTSTPDTIKEIDSWRCLDIGSTEVIYYDKVRVGVSDIERLHPKMTIMISAHKADFAPSLDELIKMNDISPLVQILSDGGDPPWHDETIRWRDAFTTIVSIDGNPNWPSRSCDLTLLTPIDLRYYDNIVGETTPERNILLGFSGGIGSGARGMVMSNLRDRGLLTYRSMSLINSYKGYTGEAASYKEYADFMRQCKIIINHAMTASGLSHVKGRVLEAGWAGACLLENKNPITPLWFKPGIHYIEYNDVEHAAQLVEQLKSDPGRIEQMASALHEDVIRNHSPRVFWSKVLDKIGWHPEGW